MDRAFVFPPFRFDPASGELRSGGERLPLRPKTQAVLQFLLGHRERVVTRGELLQAIWPRNHGAERAPKQCIRELRALLGDTAITPRFIETVGRHGYRFIAQFEPSVTGRGPASAEGIAGTHPSPDPLARTCVGREAELAALVGWLERARRGERGVVFVTGEPGIGKTTLVDGFIDERAAPGDLWVSRGQCVPHHGSPEAYAPLLDVLGHLWRGGRAEPRFIGLLERYAPSWLVQLPGALGETKRAVLARRSQGASPERMRRELIEALEALARERPGIVVLEDLQWSDVATLDWLAAWAERREAARLLVVGTYRPVDVIVHGHPLAAVAHELAQRGRCRTLMLGGLSQDAVEAYLRGRLAAHFPPAVSTLLHQRTEGHPLFLAALLEEWQAKGLLMPKEGHWPVEGTLAELAATVPATVRQLIEHQFAALEPSEQRLLEAASAGGLEYPAAAAAAGLGAELESVEAQCADLARRHLFLAPRSESEWPDGTLTARYGFRHALYQQVVYGQLPAGRRTGLHQRIGTRLEAAYGDEKGVIAVALAEHFEEARDYHRAVRYRRLAGETALMRHAPRTALEHLDKGLASMQRWPGDTFERRAEELRLQTALAAARIATDGFGAPGVARAYRRAYRLCRRLEDGLTLGPVLCGLWNYYINGADFRRVEALAERLSALAEASSALALRLPADNAVGQTRLFTGEPAAAQGPIDAVLACYDPRAHGHLVAQYGEDPGVVCHMYAVLTRWLLGDPERAMHHFEAGKRLAGELGQPFGVAQMLWIGAIVAQLSGDLEKVQARSEALTRLCQEEGIAQWLPGARIFMGWVLAEQGQTGAGIDAIRGGSDEWLATGAKLIQPYYLGLLAQAHARGGQRDAALGVVGEALAQAHETGERWYEAELCRLKGELLHEQNGQDASRPAELCFQRSLAIAGRQGAKSLELRTAMSLARLWQEQGKHDAADELLAPLRAWFTQGFETADRQDPEALPGALAHGPERAFTMDPGNDALFPQ